MRKVVMYCDRCKKEFEKWNHKKAELYGVAEFVYGVGEPYLDKHLDLCESCYTELENWWNLTWTIDKGTQSIKANNEESEENKLTKGITEGFEEFTKMMFKQGQKVKKYEL